SLPAQLTDFSRRWQGPNEWSTNSLPFEGRYASDLAVPLFPSTALPVGFVSNNVSRPSLSTLKLETELSPPLVVKRNRQSGLSMTLPAPSKAFGALSWPLIGLNVPDPAPPVAVRSTSWIVPFAARR